MANEAVIVELFDGGRPIDFTVPNGTAVAKGTVMVNSGARTVRAAQATDGTTNFMGIAAAEKVASDGQTNLALYTNGIFDIVCVAKGHLPKVGHKVYLSGANLIRMGKANEDFSGAAVGVALEDGVASTACEVAVGVYS